MARVGDGQERDAHRLELSLWDVAPERWVTPEGRETYEVADARIVGEQGEEEVVVEIERVADDE